MPVQNPFILAHGMPAHELVFWLLLLLLPIPVGLAMLCVGLRVWACSRRIVGIWLGLGAILIATGLRFLLFA